MLVLKSSSDGYKKIRRAHRRPLRNSQDINQIDIRYGSSITNQLTALPSQTGPHALLQCRQTTDSRRDSSGALWTGHDGQHRLAQPENEAADMADRLC